MTPARAAYLKGVMFGLTAAVIWAGWSAATRLAVTTSLDAWDIAALRFGVAGLILLPVVVRRGLARDRLGWSGLALLMAGLGPPYVLAAAAGLRFAPASDQGALNPGCMPLFVALIATAVAGEALSRKRKSGLALILAGALAIVAGHASAAGMGGIGSRTFGDALFLLAAALSAGFTVVMRQAKLDPLHAAALVATGSLALYLPPYLALRGIGLARLPLADIACQAIFQGIAVTIVALVLYGRAVLILGASGAAAFGALVPALSALFAIPLLGEWPGTADWAGIVVISAGVCLASGASPPGRAGRAPCGTAAPRGALARYATGEIVMNWDQIAGNWKQFTGKAKVQWGKLTDNDWTQIEGKRDQLVGRVQERYGIAREEAERQVAEFERRYDRV